MIVVLTDDDRRIDTVLNVENYDDNFSNVYHEAVRKWGDSDDEFFEFVFPMLQNVGYEFDILDYEIVSA